MADMSDKTEIKSAGITLPEHRTQELREQTPVYPIGAVISDETGTRYTVEDGPWYGGMNRIYKVRLRSAGADAADSHQAFFLALKQPLRPKAAATPINAPWADDLNMGVSKMQSSPYVANEATRVADGIACTLSAWQNAGSLDQYIQGGQLYEGKEAEVRERILGVAANIAGGLQYMTEAGFVHGDVKPSNILLWERDFNNIKSLKKSGAVLGDLETMTRIQSAAENMTSAPNGKDASVAATHRTAMTLRYAAPECIAGGKPGSLSDAFSFGLTLLEMYLGEAAWDTGEEACTHWREYIDAAKLTPSKDMQELLAVCLEKDATIRCRCISWMSENDKDEDWHVALWAMIHEELVQIAQEEQAYYPAPYPIHFEDAYSIYRLHMTCEHKWEDEKPRGERIFTHPRRFTYGLDRYLRCQTCGLQKEIHAFYSGETDVCDTGVIRYAFPFAQNLRMMNSVLVRIGGKNNICTNDNFGDTARSVGAGTKAFSEVIFPKTFFSTPDSVIPQTTEQLEDWRNRLKEYLQAIEGGLIRMEMTDKLVRQRLFNLSERVLNSDLDRRIETGLENPNGTRADYLTPRLADDIPLDKIKAGVVVYEDGKTCPYCLHEGVFYGETRETSDGIDLHYDEWRFCPKCFANHHHNAYSTQGWN